METMLNPGARIGSFTLIRPLGAGGAADVWLADDATLGREVALKVARKADGAATRRFLAEARALAAVRHPRVMPILSFGVDDATGRPYFAMPAMPATLAERLGEANQLSEAETASLGMALVDALSALHAAGLVHRDLKPSNILLDGAGEPVLSDPGPSGGGTPGWVAQEQLDHRDATPATDYHALGLVLYRALTGALPPPSGVLPPGLEPPPGTLPVDLSPAPSAGWERLLVALLKPDPAERLADAGTVRKRLAGLFRRARARAALRRLARHAAIAAASAAAICAAAALIAKMGAARPQSEAEVVESEFDERKWAGQAADSLQRIVGEAVREPFPAGSAGMESAIVVPRGRSLLLGDLDKENMRPVVLDGGRLLLGRSAGELQGLANCLRDFASGKTNEMPWLVSPKGRRFVLFPILVTDNGGGIESLDEYAKQAREFRIWGGVRPAAGADSPTLHVFGFTDIVLDLDGIDPGVKVTGCGKVADSRRHGDIRWFDDENPLTR